MKYCNEIRDKIAKYAATDEYTQKELCALAGIDEDTFIRWKKNHADFADALQKAKDSLMEKRLVQCSRSLSKLICGYEYDEETTEYIEGEDGKPKIRAQRIVKKRQAPSLGAIIHYQTNRDPDNWKNKQRLEMTGKDGEEIKLAPLTAEELEILANLNR